MTSPLTAPQGAGNDSALPVVDRADAQANGASSTSQASDAALSGNASGEGARQSPASQSPSSESSSSASLSDWPADWRERLAGEDKRALDQLKRHGSPADLWKKARSLEQKLSSGEYRRDLPKDATPEVLAEWRRERGIPDTPKDYKIELPDGLVLGEADRPVVDAFTQAVHEKGWDNGKVNEALSWYYAEQERQLSERAEADARFKQTAETELRADFGGDYAPNLNAVKNLLASMPEGAADNFLAGRLADGRRIGDSPGLVKWLAEISRELNPVATLMPANGGMGGKSASDRIGEIEKLMGDRSSHYWRGAQAEPMQREYRDLVEARDKRR